MALVQLNNVTKEYPSGDSTFTALKSINLNIEKGEFAGLIGPSGSGKTTLLNIIGCLDSPTKGDVKVFDSEVSGLSEFEAAKIRRENTGFIFQTFNLLPVYTAYENVEFPLLLLKKSEEERRQRVLEALEWVNMLDKAHSKPGQLSGGQAQRVAIARAIVKRPRLVLADEPSANLDSSNSLSILDTLARLNRELGIAFLFASHDEKVIGYLKRRIYLADGEITADESVDVTSDSKQSEAAAGGSH